MAKSQSVLGNKKKDPDEAKKKAKKVIGTALKKAYSNKKKGK